MAISKRKGIQFIKRITKKVANETKYSEEFIEHSFIDAINYYNSYYRDTHKVSFNELKEIRDHLKNIISEKSDFLHDKANELRGEYLHKYDTNGKAFDTFKLLFFFGKSLLVYINGEEERIIKELNESTELSDESKKNEIDSIKLAHDQFRHLISIISVQMLSDATTLSTNGDITVDIKEKLYKTCGNYHEHLKEFGETGLYLIFKAHVKSCNSCFYFNKNHSFLSAKIWNFFRKFT